VEEAWGTAPDAYQGLLPAPHCLPEPCHSMMACVSMAGGIREALPRHVAAVRTWHVAAALGMWMPQGGMARETQKMA
jgi:hypothetical protein